MFQKQQSTPSERGQHQENAKIIGEVSQAMVILQPVQHRQEIVPVMPVRFLSSHPAEQHEIHRPRIVDIGSDIHAAFRRPPEGHCGAERIARLDEKGAQADERHQDLAKTPAQNRHEASQRDKKEMPGFVERQINQMEKRFPCVVGFERREYERSPPPEQQQKHCDPSGKRQRVGRRV